MLAIANLMKRQFLAWNRDSVGDEVIIKDLKELSEGRLNVRRTMWCWPIRPTCCVPSSIGPRNDVGFEARRWWQATQQAQPQPRKEALLNLAARITSGRSYNAAGRRRSALRRHLL